MSALETLAALVPAQDAGQAAGLTSVCSAHPEVIAATLELGLETGEVVCIEATCNQVNQDGGYTGMTPADFRNFVLGIAGQVGFAESNILFGGDHLGPNPWKSRPAAEAMDKAEVLAAAYAAAGFGKIHLDASMACADDPVPLPDEVMAERAARLARAAEAGAAEGGHPPPLYIVGTEVPVPGGALEEIDTLEVTSPDDAARTLELHEAAFRAAGLDDAVGRIVAIVVQPGVEFGHANVVPFVPAEARALVDWRRGQGGVLFEAHSTDYQTPEALAALVDGGFAILKVGPGLTFALREALYGLDAIAGHLSEDYRPGTLPDAMETLMLSVPDHWLAYYHGGLTELRLQRHFSYSDRIRYYWTRPEATAAVEALMAALEGVEIPETLISQYLPRLYDDVAADRLDARARPLLRASVKVALAGYAAACERES
ncbi:D-tagatose-bisphosphate aldolase, class II, non-catalytic subunit [Pelagovum pacificum]|uniref:D-tagatose-bisphosphate aldolase, class II, non-catalytic subunit n=1 Tax=Pelagovum pacificum TaxID=2588711 RepID=A0A5C5GEW8_9RHOB|nr:D-tagatose-bisphosphate aldolase, class II, non-catalytic subunit [Pelagovum pacificum]QQA44281.1 D-tagatose-bisphosphate aldolase, class II, non-catalytic subunit [Pelagovum pacificum]TNY32597.1 D-tagatose-bisphosphate aldolase, class II, non-catalytic subunit [Pelagovum pacificum]